MAWAGWPVSPADPPVSALPALGSLMYAATPDLVFKHGVWESYPGPSVCTANIHQLGLPTAQMAPSVTTVICKAFSTESRPVPWMLHLFHFWRATSLHGKTPKGKLQEGTWVWGLHCSRGLLGGENSYAKIKTLEGSQQEAWSFVVPPPHLQPG